MSEGKEFPAPLPPKWEKGLGDEGASHLKSVRTIEGLLRIEPKLLTVQKIWDN